MKLPAVVLGLLSSCAAPAPSPAPSGVPIAPATSTGTSPPAPSSPSVAPGPVIESGGVGEIRIGKPIPAQHLSDAADARRRYEIRWVADAQPFEAFRIDDPPVIACIDGGPFERWAKDNVGPLEPARFADGAITFAKAGAAVTWIVIERAGPKTATGIGVGSSWRDVEAAHPGTTIVRDPEWFEPRITCRARLREIPGVEVLLSRCDDQRGDVVRVLINR